MLRLLDVSVDDAKACRLVLVCACLQSGFSSLTVVSGRVQREQVIFRDERPAMRKA